MKVMYSIKAVILVMLLLITVYVPMPAYVISREGGIIHGVNQYGNHYFINKKSGYVDYVNLPGNFYYDIYGSSYRLLIPRGTSVSDNVNYIQFAPGNYIPKKKKINWGNVYNVFIGVCFVCAIIGKIMDNR